MRVFLLALLTYCAVCGHLFAADKNVLNILYLEIAQPERPTLSNLDPIPSDLGEAGATLAINDSNTTGAFMNFALEMEHLVADDLEDAKSVLSERSEQFVILDMNGAQVSEISDNADRLFFNVSAYDDELRREDCRFNVMHTLPSYAMRADSLLQFAVKKRWDKLALIEGNSPKDAKFASALRSSAKKFGLKFTADEKWIFDEDMRRSASSEVPLFSQKLGDYDALMIADEWNDFARYVRYNTWLARPVMGGDGLQALGWSRVVEQWGAAQLQSRFHDLAGRNMQSEDYAAWAAVRSLGEAFLQTKFGEKEDIVSYLKSDLVLAGFKGRPLSFRPWNGQLRQPIALAHSSALVAMTPLEGFLHEGNELDSLGVSERERKCKF